MKALRKEFYVQIKKTLQVFYPAFNCCPWCGFLCGIRSTEPDMKKICGAIYDKENIYDIRVVSELWSN